LWFDVVVQLLNESILVDNIYGQTNVPVGPAEFYIIFCFILTPFAFNCFVVCFVSFIVNRGDVVMFVCHVIKCLLHFRCAYAVQKAVPSLCWSPHNATVFACVNEGAVEVWDFSQSGSVFSTFFFIHLLLSSTLPSLLLYCHYVTTPLNLRGLI